MTPEMSALKARLKTTWESGDYARFAKYLEPGALEFFDRLNIPLGTRLLDVACGAGQLTLPAARKGIQVTGLDLAANLVLRARARAAEEGLTIQVDEGDAENLPFESGSFDVGYSFGVLHHSPNPEKAIRELVRVVRPGGEVKIMLYNRRSICAINAWVKNALLRGRPWKNVAWAVWHHVESIGTQSYTRRELNTLIESLPLDHVHVQTEVTAADTLASSSFLPLNLAYKFAIWLAGTRYPWKLAAYSPASKSPAPLVEPGPQFSGNPLGWFHNISARKKST